MRNGPFINLAEYEPKPERKTKLSSFQYGVTFAELAVVQPKLLELLTEAQGIHGVDYESCPVNRWYGYSDRKNALKQRIKRLTGDDTPAQWVAADYIWGQVKSCKHCTDRPFAEADLEWDFVERLRKSGAEVRTQVHCRFGRADIVTANTVYEIKLFLTRQAIFQAIGQATLYAHALGKPNIGVGGQLTAETHRLLPALKERGIAVELWDYPATVYGAQGAF